MNFPNRQGRSGLFALQVEAPHLPLSLPRKSRGGAVRTGRAGLSTLVAVGMLVLGGLWTGCSTARLSVEVDSAASQSAPISSLMVAEEGPDLLARPDIRMMAPGDRFGQVDVASMLSVRREPIRQEQSVRPPQVDKPWTFLGPGNYGGKVMDVAVHPNDSGNVFAAYNVGGLWHTKDGGGSWRRVFDTEHNNYVPSVTFWSNNPDVVYAGLGRPGRMELDRGVVKSTDGGNTWQGIGPIHDRAFAIYRILTHPTDPQILWVAGEGGVFRTSNGGTVWDLVLEWDAENWWDDLPDLIMDRADPNVLFAAQKNLGIAKSVDGGLSWVSSDSGVEPGDAIMLAQCLTTGTLYAMRPHDPWPSIALYRSVNSGTSWQLHSTSLSFFHQGRYDLSITVDPADPDHILVGNVALLESRDGGKTFQNRTWTAGIVAGNTPHADHLRLVFSPSDNQRIYSGNDGGIWRSDDGGVRWGKVDSGVQTNLAFNMAVTKGGERIYLTSGDWGLGQIYENGLWRDYFGYEWQFYYAEPDDADIVYTSNGFSRLSRVHYDGGSGNPTGVDPCPGGNSPYARPFLFDPDDPATIFASCARVYRSTNRGSTWTPISPDWGEVYIMAIAPTNSKRIVVHTVEGVKKTDDGGLTWTPLARTPAYPQSILFDPHDDEVFFIGAVWEFQKYSGFGASEVSVHGNLPDSPVRRIAISPDDGTMVVTLDDMAFLSRDGGTSWYRLGQGLPKVDLWDLALLGDQVWVSGAQGVWHYDLSIPPCEPSATVACLVDGRFRVTGTMQDFSQPPKDYQLTVLEFPEPRAETPQAVFLESFSSGNFEAGVKMVDGCTLDPGNPLRAYWLFAGGLTNAATDLSIRDTVTGETVRWSNAAGQFPTSLGRTDAFPCVTGVPDCQRDDATACLLDRFAVSGIMSTFDVPPTEVGTRVMTFPNLRAESNQAVFFESFNQGNFEIGVKMVDGCSLPSDHPLRSYWVFFGGLTNAATEVHVTQISTGIIESWSVQKNSYPTTFSNTQAFPCD